MALTWSAVLLSLLVVCASAAGSLPDDWFRGSVYFALNANDFTVDGVLETLKYTQASLPGLTHVPLQWIYKQDNATSNVVRASPKTTPTLDSLRTIIRNVHSLGLKTALKPIVVARDNVQMMSLNPSDPVLWMNSYATHFLEVVSVAAAEGVDIISVGIELLIIASSKDNEPLWRQLIAATRELCPACRLTYGSNPLLDETQLVPFWDALDFVGVDLYFPFISPFAPAGTPMPDEAGMQAFYNLVLEKHLLNWYVPWETNFTRIFGRPAPKLVVMESGYPSTNIGMRTPWLPADNCSAPGPYGETANMTAQMLAYQVQFDALTAPPAVDYFAGFTQFWMGMPGSDDWIMNQNETGSNWACGWTIAGKPALDVVASAFARNSTA
jgi:hypothetical protein